MASGSLFAFARLYRDWGGSVDDDRARVAELHWAEGRVVQISSHHKDDGVLIRVWPKNGTHEYGGGNITAASISLKWADDGGVEVEHFEVRTPWERHRDED